jgi:hypothetical protein
MTILFKTNRIALVLSIVFAASLAKQAVGDDMGCDPVYLKNLQELRTDLKDTSHVFRSWTLKYEIGSDGSKLGLATLASKLGWVAIDSATLTFMLIGAGVSIVESGVIVGALYGTNRSIQTSYVNAYKVIQQAETGGGPDLDKLYAELGKDNPKWSAQGGMTPEVFRKVILELNHRSELCSSVAGLTLDEMTQKLQNLSDARVSNWENYALKDFPSSSPSGSSLGSSRPAPPPGQTTSGEVK